MNHLMIDFVEDLKRPLSETDWEPYVKPAGFARINAIRLKAAILIELTNAETHLKEMAKVRDQRAEQLARPSRQARDGCDEKRL